MFRTRLRYSTVIVDFIKSLRRVKMALLQLLKPAVVPRSQVAHSNPILYDGGRAVNEFFAPGTEYFGRQVIPPDNKWSDGSRSFMGMPLPCFTSAAFITWRQGCVSQPQV
jgi:hypothetical protein